MTSHGRPTHFLSLPVGRHVELQARATELIESCFSSSLDPAIPASARRYVEPVVRLHVTLGVMRLADHEATDRAIALLVECRRPLLDLLAGRGLRMDLDGLGSFPEGSTRKIRVLYATPSSPPDQEGLLEAVADYVRRTFKDAGFITDRTELTFHCTLLKAPPRRQDRFDGTAVLALLADLGVYDVEDLLLCRMGAYDKIGRHVSIGGISLLPSENTEADG